MLRGTKKNTKPPITLAALAQNNAAASSMLSVSSMGSFGLGAGERWPADGERNVSPSEARSGRATPAGVTVNAGTGPNANASSDNWRHSTLTTSSASSGFTRFSNGSVRSVSTTATSMSGGSGSWRNSNNSSASLPSVVGHGKGAYPPSVGSSKKSDKSGLSMVPPPNVKSAFLSQSLPSAWKTFTEAFYVVMEGVPWALDELPRQLSPNFSVEHVGRKQRARKPKDLPTITERPSFGNGNGNGKNAAVPALRSPLSQRMDAGRSSSELASPVASGSKNVMGASAGAEGAGGSGDVEGEDGIVTEDERADGTPRKVQKGQIHALAKMLSALRR